MRKKRMVEHRLRLKEEEITELRVALLKHIRDLVESRVISWERFVRLQKLYYRLYKAEGVKRGVTFISSKTPHIGKEEMYQEMKRWLRLRSLMER
ncbi:TPA: hypothetical protein EYP70_07785 [Candidatus Bathyarchaeota archaeon]|nr:hypothetical protein [Candidatus Bathyarchaeota archaeon]